MDSNSAKTLALHVGPHLAYKAFAESIGATPLRIETRVDKKQDFLTKGVNFTKSVLAVPGGYDVYLTETCYYYAAAARRMRKIRGKIVNVCASPMFYNMLHGVIKGKEKDMLLEFAKDIDGMIIEGEYVGELVRKLGIDVPTRTVYTYIGKQRYQELQQLKPNLGSKNISIIATNDYRYKGVDMLLRAMKFVNEEDPEITLNIVLGNIDPKEFGEHMVPSASISYEVAPALEASALYVHPSRGDVFPVAPLEAMMAGLPVMVSDETGTREVVGKVRPDFVLPMTPKEIAGKILEYFSLELGQRQKLSDSFRKAAMPFSEEEQVARFKREYSGLLQHL
ncbi:MAG: glycosyltransferase [Candidatus Micrarchaeota archaeon]